MNLEVLFTPAEIAALASRDLRDTACVVFDVLRATSTFAAALHNGAKEIIPVAEISEALEIKKARPEVLLGGERNGVKISASGIDFDLGNSTREYTREIVRGKTIVSTTTNGTRALRACAGAKMVLAASFLNLGATAEFLRRKKFTDILIVCAGTRENAALEDTLAAGALCEMLSGGFAVRANSVSVENARHAYAQAKPNLAGAMRDSENALRLLANPDLRDDVAFCLQRDICPLIARMEADGAIRLVALQPGESGRE
jgi:2-phosphosulfolactate phosphatase